MADTTAMSDAVTTAPSEVQQDYTSITAAENLKIIYLAIGTIGLIGNLLVVIVIGSSATMRKTMTNKYILNQSVCDFTVAVILIFSSIFEDTGRHLAGAGDELYCRLWLTKMPLWGTLVSSTYNLVAMTIERYLAVVYPIWHKMSFNTTKFAISVAFVWILGIGFNMAYMVPSTQIQHGACNLYAMWPSTQAHTAIGVLTIILQYFIPLFIQSFCYIRMVLALKSRIHPSDATSDDTKNGKKVDKMARARKNIIKTLALVSVSFIVCWTWNQIFFLLFNLGYSVNFQSNFYHFTVVAVFCNCCINPFIYMVKYEQFQRGLRRLFCRPKFRGAESEFSNSNMHSNATT